MKRKFFKGMMLVISLILAFCCLAPFVIVIKNSMWTPWDGLKFRAYYDVFLSTPKYLTMFWNGMRICLCIAVGQVVISVLAGVGFAKFEFPGKNIIFFALMILMTLPIQVTLIPNYLMLTKMGLVGKDASLIWPNLVLPLGTFIATQSFKAVPEDILDSAKLDGCGLSGILMRMLVPMCKGMLVCVGVLSFLDSWNMVEQPSVFLNTVEDYPLAVALAYVSYENQFQQYVGCILALIPPLLVFSCFHKEMSAGIVLEEVR